MRVLLLNEDGDVISDVDCPDARSVTYGNDGIWAADGSGSERIFEFDGLSWFDTDGQSVDFHAVSVQA